MNCDPPGRVQRRKGVSGSLQERGVRTMARWRTLVPEPHPDREGGVGGRSGSATPGGAPPRPASGLSQGLRLIHGKNGFRNHPLLKAKIRCRIRVLSSLRTVEISPISPSTRPFSTVAILSNFITEGTLRPVPGYSG